MSAQTRQMYRRVVDGCPVFFAHCHPLTSIIHQPSFLHALSQGKVPRYLLLSMFAVAVPYSLRPALRTTPTWHAGERFALEAKRCIFDSVDEPLGIRSEPLDGLHVKPSLELAQALCLLQTHERIVKAFNESDRLLKLAHAVLDALDILTLESQDGTLHENFVRIEALRRVFWHLHCVELLSPNTERTRDKRERVNTIRLPLEDALFDMPRIESRAGYDEPYEYLPLPLGPKQPCRSEFGNLIRVCEIYTAVLEAIAQRGERPFDFFRPTRYQRFDRRTCSSSMGARSSSKPRRYSVCGQARNGLEGAYMVAKCRRQNVDFSRRSRDGSSSCPTTSGSPKTTYSSISPSSTVPQAPVLPCS